MKLQALFLACFATASFCLAEVPQEAGRPLVILQAPDASPLEQLAAREVRRYVYLRTGETPPIEQTLNRSDVEVILIMTRERHDWAYQALERISYSASADISDQIALQQWLREEVGTLKEDTCLLRSILMPYQRRHCLFLVGGSAASTLYAAYRFAELLDVRFYLHGDVLPDTRREMPLMLPEIDERHEPLFSLRGIQPFHDFPEGPDWWTLENYKSVIAQLPKMGMNFIGLHTYPLAEPTVWVGLKEDVNPDGAVAKSYPTQYYNTGMQVGWGYAVRPTSNYACGASQLFPRDDYGADFLSPYTPRPDSEEECNAVFNKTGEVFREAFTLARSLGVKTCIGTETPLSIPPHIMNTQNMADAPIIPVGGAVARYGAPIANTAEDPLYQSVRYNLSAYRFKVPEGLYKVTLKFCEVAYDTVGARVFNVTLQDKPVIEDLDMVAVAGKNVALDYTFENVAPAGGLITVGFQPVVELPAIAAIEVAGPNATLKVNCGGETYEDWSADAGLEPDPALLQSAYEGIFTRIQQAHPLDYYWFWTPENWTWEGATEAQASRTLRDIQAAAEARKAVGAPFSLATCGWVLGPPFDRAYLHHTLPEDIAVSCINRHLGYEPVDEAFSTIDGRGKWAIPWVEDDPAMASPQFWARRMRRDAQTALEYGCDGLMGIFWRTHVIAPTLASLARAGWRQEWPEPPTPEGHYRLRDVAAGFPNTTIHTSSAIEGTEDDFIYQTARINAKTYLLAVADGTYQVKLHFCEIQHGPGTRIFDVSLQGNTVLNDFDIAAEAGINRALVRIFDGIPVTGGRLRVDFTRKKDWPAIAAIEAIGNGSNVKINCGAGKSGNFDGDAPEVSEDPSALDFYVDWAAHEFGDTVGQEAGMLFHGIDGTHPRTSSWIGGPGKFFPDERPWEAVKDDYGFVDAFATLRDRVAGAGALERFDYWFHTLAFMRATGRMNCCWGAFNRAMEGLKQAPEEQRKALALEMALPARIALVDAAREAYEHLLGTVSTQGELGTICNLEAHTFVDMLDAPEQELEALLGAPLPEAARLPHEYSGPTRLIVPAVRTSRSPNEPLKITAMALCPSKVERVTLHWRLLGDQAEFMTEEIRPEARNVFSGIIENFPESEDIEYYIEASTVANETVRWPVTAPKINQTVVVHQTS